MKQNIRVIIAALFAMLFSVPADAGYFAPDPVMMSGGLNVYAYARGNPLRYIDPLGLYENDINCAKSGIDCTPRPPSSSPVGSCMAMCTESLLSEEDGGFSEEAIIGQAMSIIGGTPIPKQWLGYPSAFGSSSFTNPISVAGLGGPKLPFKVFGTNRVFGALGRGNICLRNAALIFDGSAIASCTASCVSRGLQ